MIFGLLCEVICLDWHSKRDRMYSPYESRPKYWEKIRIKSRKLGKLSTQKFCIKLMILNQFFNMLFLAIFLGTYWKKETPSPKRRISKNRYFRPRRKIGSFFRGENFILHMKFFEWTSNSKYNLKFANIFTFLRHFNFYKSFSWIRFAAAPSGALR